MFDAAITGLPIDALGLDPQEGNMFNFLITSLGVSEDSRTGGAIREYLAVDPSKQGTGLGSLILKESLKVIDDLNEAAYLESSNPKNMSLYERYGFRFVKKIQVGTSPEINTMYREQKK